MNVDRSTALGSNPCRAPRPSSPKPAIEAWFKWASTWCHADYRRHEANWAPWTLRIYMGSFDRFNLRISPARISPPADAPPVKFITAPPQQHQRRSL
jgi:hypothetical protein